jgi:CTP synthase (UTP-ammonia lyase)
MKAVHVGLVGDHDDRITAHRAIPQALQRVAQHLGTPVDFEWIASDSVMDVERLARFDAMWCVPGSPYRSMVGALYAIRFARERRVPFLGTCGGFQHAVIEYARNVLGWADADHAETSPAAERAVISPLACSLVEANAEILFEPGSRISGAYARLSATEGYHCSYGLNPVFADSLISGPLRVTAHDAQGDVRAIELNDHPFFVATLFQPERAALRGEVPALAHALVEAAMLVRRTAGASTPTATATATATADH